MAGENLPVLRDNVEDRNDGQDDERQQQQKRLAAQREKASRAAKRLKSRAGSAAKPAVEAARKQAQRGGARARKEARAALEQARAGAKERIAEQQQPTRMETEPEDVFERAERSATMADPIGATLNPTSTIEDVQFMAGAEGSGVELTGTPDDGGMPEATMLAMPSGGGGPQPGESVSEALDAGLSVTGGEDLGDGPDLDESISLGMDGDNDFGGDLL